MAEAKILVMLNKKPGLSDADFRRLYEEEHAPLVGRQIAACEERFLDRSALAMYLVEEAISDGDPA